MNSDRAAKVFIFEVGFSISALEHCRKMKFRIQLHVTLINTIFKYCHVSMNIYNVDVLYLENGNVHTCRTVLKTKTTTMFFSHKTFSSLKNKHYL